MNFKESISQDIAIYLKKVEAKCKLILKEEIQKSVYDFYSPTYYADGKGNRTDQLTNSVSTKIENNILYVYIDEKKLDYFSVVDGSDQSLNVPFYVNYGHKDSTNINDMYHNYSARKFIESAAKRIKKELNLNVKIMNDRSSVHLGGYDTQRY